MQTLWMGIRPGLDITRILVQDAGIAILKARLPEAPHHPRVLETLAEGIALWCGRPLYAVLGAADPDPLCVTPPWRATIEQLTRTPLVTIDFVPDRPRPPRRGDGLPGLGAFDGAFDDVRQLRLEEWRR